MTIDEIREKLLDRLTEYYCMAVPSSLMVDAVLSTEIVPERECPWCKGSDELLKIDCPYHCIANRLPPITIEQAIKKVMECQLK